MLYKTFYLILTSLSPWTATLSTPAVLVKAPQVEIVEMAHQPKEEKSVYLVEKKQEVLVALQKWAKADQDVLQQFDLFLASLQEGIASHKISKQDAEFVLDALMFGAEKHKGQARVDQKKTPYIIHPIEVADFVMRIGKVYDKEILVASLLHDVLDDTGTTYEELSKCYGNTVAQYVQEMTSKKGLTLKEQKKLQIIQAFHQTPSVAIIKLSDKLSNLGALASAPPSAWTRDRIDQYFQWAQSVIENLPEANPLLKKAVKDTISSYWEQQERYQKA